MQRVSKVQSLPLRPPARHAHLCTRTVGAPYEYSTLGRVPYPPYPAHRKLCLFLVREIVRVCVCVCVCV